MADWLMSANSKKYDHERAFKEQGYVFWRQIRNFVNGDNVYIYCTKPIGMIMYAAIVEETDIPYTIAKTDQKFYSNGAIQKDGLYIKLKLKSTYGGEKLSYESLQEYHFIPPQGPQRIKDKALLAYIKAVFSEADNEE